MPTPLLIDLGSHLVSAAPAEFGYVGLAVAGREVTGVSFAHRTAADAVARLKKLLKNNDNGDVTGTAPDERLLWGTLDHIVQFLTGEPADLRSIPISLARLSPFQRRVVAACRAIPFGLTRSYGQVAAAAGSPGAARAVGQVMATNRYPLVVPCHRVIASDGGLGGFSAPQGISLKRRLLAFEASVADNVSSTACKSTGPRMLARM